MVRASMNLDLDGFDEKYDRRMSTDKCPVWRKRFDPGALIVENGKVCMPDK